jgi:hypothetical protein
VMADRSLKPKVLPSPPQCAQPRMRLLQPREGGRGSCSTTAHSAAATGAGTSRRPAAHNALPPPPQRAVRGAISCAPCRVGGSFAPRLVGVQRLDPMTLCGHGSSCREEKGRGGKGKRGNRGEKARGTTNAGASKPSNARLPGLRRRRIPTTPGSSPRSRKMWQCRISCRGQQPPLGRH